MLSAVRTILLVAAFIASPRDAAARCGDVPEDAAEVATARLYVDAFCVCPGPFTTHAEYVRCASGVVRDRVAAGSLRAACRASVIRCASRSTCGRAGTTTCCRTTAAGGTRCRIVGAGRCNPPRGGTACETSFTSCCDACTTGGCATTTTTVSTTTATTLRDCIGAALIDPDGTIITLPRGAPISVPVRAASSTGGIFDIFMDDNGAGGQVLCPPSGCLTGINLPPGGFTTVNFTYTADIAAPATITLTARLNPHSIGNTCGFGSFGGMSSRVYPTSGP
jgi:hypothetical protein